MGAKSNIPPATTAASSRAFEIKLSEFGRLPTGEQISRVNGFMSEACPGILQENPISCFIGTASVSRVLKELPAETQGRVLAGLQSYHRQRLFQDAIKDKDPNKIAKILLQIQTEQVPALMAMIPDPARVMIIGAMKVGGNPKGLEMATAWDNAYQTRWQVRMIADDTDLRATLAEMPDEMLLKAHRQERVKPDSRTSAMFGVEITARKDKANLEGNGIDLTGAENHFSDLRVESYQNAVTWSIAGTYKKNGIGPATDFRYTALPQKYWQELTLDGRTVIPSDEQDQFFHEKIFAKARRSSLAKPHLESANPIPKEFGPLSFHRVDVFCETRKVRKLKPGAGGSGGIMDLLKGKEESVSDDKPQRKYYLTGSEDHLVIIRWNEVTDQLSMDVFLGLNQMPSDTLSGAIDDTKARGLIPVVRALKGETKEDGQRLSELVKKLEAIAEFR